MSAEMDVEGLYLCACHEFYDSHHPECPALRQHRQQAEEIERLKRDIEKWLADCRVQNDHIVALHEERATLTRQLQEAVEERDRLHKGHTDSQVFFYEREFYVLSNFSAFRLEWKGIIFDTSEAAYHWEKFPQQLAIQRQIIMAPSAHAAFKLAEKHRERRRPDWDSVKTGIMKQILRAKADQHEYVRRKLLETGDRELIEDSWRDDYWGWGPNRDGQNMLGKLWMEVRSDLRADALTDRSTD